MKRHHWLLIIITIAVMAGCTKPSSHEQNLYQCPMHPTYTSNQPGTCPICGMTLVKVEPQKESSAAPEGHEGHQPPQRTTITIPDERRQAIGVTTTVVERKKLFRAIRTVGQVAFDPALATAQREYIEAKRLGDTSLTQAAMDRLQLLGMSRMQIEDLSHVQKNLYLPSKDGKVWIYATLYEPDLALIAVGQEMSISAPGSEETLSGIISAIDPIVDAMTRTVRARGEIIDPKGTLKPGRYVDVDILIPLGASLAIPSSAVLHSGTTSYVFLDRGEGKLEPRVIDVGPRAGDDTQVLSGLEEGNVVVTSAQFLIDAESSLAAAMQTLGTSKAPTCPEGQHWDTSMNMCM